MKMKQKPLNEQELLLILRGVYSKAAYEVETMNTAEAVGDIAARLQQYVMPQAARVQKEKRSK
ncbi:hypothetical protein M3202_19075 [Alkalihalobacillus oceani]|uniref:Uncharacterized protein n=1 Tax=Halalkalibacter oceani TaxID=1653776 RepID=A0A9X2IQC9_9BACI|nr:hypothetical protein [Halalkalibacter oceani]MCM3716150.1 hypothetical protein [Halalkalibacter oceani]